MHLDQASIPDLIESTDAPDSQLYHHLTLRKASKLLISMGKDPKDYKIATITRNPFQVAKSLYKYARPDAFNQEFWHPMYNEGGGVQADFNQYINLKFTSYYGLYDFFPISQARRNWKAFFVADLEARHYDPFVELFHFLGLKPHENVNRSAKVNVSPQSNIELIFNESTVSRIHKLFRYDFAVHRKLEGSGLPLQSHRTQDKFPE